MFVVLLATLSAHAAGLDQIDVGGVWGSPGATNPTAIWWNPAGLAVGGGTQFLIEGAPVFARVYADRANPDYGLIEETTVDGELGEDFPRDYDYSGRDDIKLNTAIPFIGVSTDFTVPGLGVGAGLAVPTATGGAIENEWGPNRYALRSGQIQAPQVILAASYRIKEIVSFGVSGNLVDSTWSANTDTSAYPDLYDYTNSLVGSDDPFAFAAPLALRNFRDGYIENQGYTATTVFDKLKDRAFTFGAGVYLTPHEKLGISVAYNHGVRLDHTGPLTITSQCPPDFDPLVRQGAVDAGLCRNDGDNNFQPVSATGTGAVGYRLPSRVNLGIVFFPTEAIRLEAMGSYVGWSVFTDYEITTNIGADQIDASTPEKSAETADLLTQDRLWARDGRDTFWVGLDHKHQVHERFMYGARVAYDRSAVPTNSLLLNNFGADSVNLHGMVMFNALEQLGIAVSFTRYQYFTRTVTDTNFGMTIYPEDRKEVRYFYPGGNGTYGGGISRLGISLRGQFGKDGVKW